MHSVLLCRFQPALQTSCCRNQKKFNRPRFHDFNLNFNLNFLVVFVSTSSLPHSFYLPKLSSRVSEKDCLKKNMYFKITITCNNFMHLWPWPRPRCWFWLWSRSASHTYRHCSITFTVVSIILMFVACSMCCFLSILLSFCCRHRNTSLSWFR